MAAKSPRTVSGTGIGPWGLKLGAAEGPQDASETGFRDRNRSLGIETAVRIEHDDDGAPFQGPESVPGD